MNPAPLPMPREAVIARWIYAFISLQFVVPALSYAVQPSIAIDQLNHVSLLLGGAAITVHEHQGYPWHMLATGNVMTLGFMNALLAWDTRKYFGTLPGLLFLKGFSSLYSLFLALTGGPRFFYGVFLLDGVTALVMAWAGPWAMRAWAKAEAAAKAS